MHSSEILLTLAEISITLAGFIGLLAVFKRSVVWSSEEILRLFSTLGLCFAAITASVLPEAVSHFSNSEFMLWGLPLLVAGVTPIFTSGRVIYKSFATGYTYTSSLGKMVTYLTIGVGLVIVLAAFDVVGPRGEGMLIFAVLFLILLAGLSFALSIIRSVSDAQEDT
jgi:hypothetical protein